MSEDSRLRDALEVRYYEWLANAGTTLVTALYPAVQLHRHTFGRNNERVIVTFEIRDTSVIEPDPERQVFQAIGIVQYSLHMYRKNYLDQYFGDDVLYDMMPKIVTKLLVEKVINQQLKTSAFDIAILAESDSKSTTLKFGKFYHGEDGYVFDQLASPGTIDVVNLPRTMLH